MSADAEAPYLDAAQRDPMLGCDHAAEITQLLPLDADTTVTWAESVDAQPERLVAWRNGTGASGTLRVAALETASPSVRELAPPPLRTLHLLVPTDGTVIAMGPSEAGPEILRFSRADDGSWVPLAPLDLGLSPAESLGDAAACGSEGISAHLVFREDFATGVVFVDQSGTSPIVAEAWYPPEHGFGVWRSDSDPSSPEPRLGGCVVQDGIAMAIIRPGSRTDAPVLVRWRAAGFVDPTPIPVGSDFRVDTALVTAADVEVVLLGPSDAAVFRVTSASVEELASVSLTGFEVERSVGALSYAGRTYVFYRTGGSDIAALAFDGREALGPVRVVASRCAINDRPFDTGRSIGLVAGCSAGIVGRQLALIEFCRGG